MAKAYISGSQQIDATIQMPQGQAVAGGAVGILVLDLWYPYLPGNVANASTYDFPVFFKVLSGSTIPQVLKADPVPLDMTVEGGGELIKQGQGPWSGPAAISPTTRRQPPLWRRRSFFPA